VESDYVPTRHGLETGEPVAFTNGHHYPEAFTDFPFDDLDPHQPERIAPNAADKALAADALMRMLQWCWPREHATGSFRAAFTRFAALSSSMRPELLDNGSFKSIGERLGVTRALLSKYSVEFEQTFGVQFRRGRSAIARAHMRQARLRQRGPEGRVIARRS